VLIQNLGKRKENKGATTKRTWKKEVKANTEESRERFFA